MGEGGVMGRLGSPRGWVWKEDVLREVWKAIINTDICVPIKAVYNNMVDEFLIKFQELLLTWQGNRSTGGGTLQALFK